MLCNNNKKKFGKKYKKEILKILLSDNTISQLIKGLYENTELQVIFYLQKMNMFELQLDESVDITSKSQILAFPRFIHKERIIE